MKRFLLAALALCSFPAIACISIAPEAQSWEERSARLAGADIVRIEAQVAHNGQVRSLFIQKTQLGTIACLDGMEQCNPLSSLASINAVPSVGALYEWLTATAPNQSFGQVSSLPGASKPWAAPSGVRGPEDWSATFKRWTYNPEVGFPMPTRVEVAARGRHPSFTLTLERFAVGEPSSACCR